MKTWLARLGSVAMLASLWGAGTAVAGPAVTADEWATYTAKFLTAEGRVVDTANGSISHSEGQGYGLLLAYLANNRSDFDRIWSFTRTELLLRDDGLAVWKWDPGKSPHVQDSNNATDGDLLIAYAAALAGAAWNRPDLTGTAAIMAKAIMQEGVWSAEGMTMLKPGAVGFGAGERSDGPIVNPSYWVYETFDVMNELAPDQGWQRLSVDGRKLLQAAMSIGPVKLPPDWVSLHAAPAVADGFPQQFSYNAVRIPLYLIRSGDRDRSILEPFAQAMSDESGKVRLVDITSGRTSELLADPGYRIIPAALRCTLDGTRLPADLTVFQATEYYPSTLQLLALSYMRRRHPECL